MSYTLPDLPYSYDALEPHIDARTMEIHHTKHHQAYITKVNDALKGSELLELPVETLITRLDEVPEAVRTAVRNNGGGHANHSLFWTLLSGQGGGTPTGPLADAIDKELGGFEKFKESFTQAAVGRFGSGWAWLSVTSAGLRLTPVSIGHKIWDIIYVMDQIWPFFKNQPFWASLFYRRFRKPCPQLSSFF